MPRREDISTILVIGSGPITIGQAAEFDYSGTQALKALKEEDYRVILLNSNPATIQTDPIWADRVYIEPTTWEVARQIIREEVVDGLVAGMGGQTALNIAAELKEKGVLDEEGVRLLGVNFDAIETAEDRELFRQLMLRLGEPIPRSRTVRSVKEAKVVVEEVGGYPVLVRPAYTLGGTGGGIAMNEEELTRIVYRGLLHSRVGQVLIEESVLGWKEYEYEVVRDSSNTAITICSMENLDPMGVHTGESVVVAPAQTLSDEANQMLRNAALKIIRALKIEGGCNIQFAYRHDTGEYRVVEVNPRLSRSSALASKATGYPIARIAAKIAVGYLLKEIRNPITGTSAAFEPSLDYVVVKIPRWPFDKFVNAVRRLDTQMKSTGEVMAIGRNMEEALQKALRSLELSFDGFKEVSGYDHRVLEEVEMPTDRRLLCVAEALRRGYPPKKVAELSGYHIFFVEAIERIVRAEGMLKEVGWGALSRDDLWELKRMGFSDTRIAHLGGVEERAVRDARWRWGIRPAFKIVDTCAGEFKALTPYYYSTYLGRRGQERRRSKKRVLIVGSGPIRIGQGVEFDYSCVKAALTLREEGYEAVMVNNNPETVSTDFDISSQLYFEPLTLEDVLEALQVSGSGSVVLQFGGQTAVNLAMPLREEVERLEIPLKFLGTSPENMDLAEDRGRFHSLLTSLGLKQPSGGVARSFEEVLEIVERLGYPVLVRPSYVLGGRAMEIIYSEEELKRYFRENATVTEDHPTLVDEYLSGAKEVDVDAVSDGQDVFVPGVMEHIEEAGVHSGDSHTSLPPFSLTPEVVEGIEEATKKIALALGTVGLINIQFAVKDGEIYVLEANPRASRTVPFVSKATGIPLVPVAVRAMLGTPLSEQGLPREGFELGHFAIKAPVFPFLKLEGLDPILGPEMKSTGEVMGIGADFGEAYYKAIRSRLDEKFSSGGTAYITVKDEDKERCLPVAKELLSLGFKIVATPGTAEFLRSRGIEAEVVYRISDGKKPNALDLMRNGKVNLIINTPTAKSGPVRDGMKMRRLAVELMIPFITTVEGAFAEVEAIKSSRGELKVRPLDKYWKGLRVQGAEDHQ